MSDLPPLPAIKTGRYRHYKGGEYEITGVARHSESGEELVVYRPRYGDGRLWVRPREMFLEKVRIQDEETPRFRYLGPGESERGVF